MTLASESLSGLESASKRERKSQRARVIPRGSLKEEIVICISVYLFVCVFSFCVLIGDHHNVIAREPFLPQSTAIRPSNVPTAY